MLSAKDGKGAAGSLSCIQSRERRKSKAGFFTFFRLTAATGLLAAAAAPAIGHDSSGSTVLLRFAGDCLLAEHYEAASDDDPALAFRGFDLLRTADVAMVNLESPITVRGTPSVKPYTFRTHPRYVAVLRDAGIDIVTLANNHIHDYGTDGLFDTIAFLDSAGIRHVGAGRNHEEAHRGAIMTVNGVRIGFLGYYQGSESPPAVGDHPGVADRRTHLIERDIHRLQRDSVSFIVVNIHWGTEKASTPDTWQITLGRAIIDAGADVVIGHHPHVLQGIERYRHGVIAYSLGNFIFGGNSRHSYDTGVLELQLDSSGVSCAFVPVRVTRWTAATLQGSPADSLRNHMQSLSSVFPSTIPFRKEHE